ncbi:MAG: NADH-quinone oxidoreductase subunit L [Betaproteobacteria bacterium]|nr:NADH-quinone oxidoreductase subunit L [Betaproteobacteria bacterium]MDE2622575.1 NADH-quinone oxidoreductase subunit L [Betaproteobacteria bacterium]
MFLHSEFSSFVALAPAALMLLSGAAANTTREPAVLWKRFAILSGLALAFAVTSLAFFLLASAIGTGTGQAPLPGLLINTPGLWFAALVQLLGTVIGSFSSRYLQGEPGQGRYMAKLSGVLAAVQILLLADNWFVLIMAWAWAGTSLQHLLCFYPERPFALLAAHKKRIADRAADLLLLAAAAAALLATGHASISGLLQQISTQKLGPALEVCAIALVLGVILRTSLLPAHGWLIQVMEAPTPVSALLHAGVVNLGGFVLIRFAPLLDASDASRWLLIVSGLATAVLSGFVMLTRISIKVQLAWSTVAQMGFMVLECGLGLYQLALLHLMGHSLYKANAFLSASGTVRQTRLRRMQGLACSRPASLLAAPVLSLATILLVQSLAQNEAWPWWWTGVLALAWAPLFWLPTSAGGSRPPAWLLLMSGVCMTALLTAAALLWHQLPLGVSNEPDALAGLVALGGIALMYLGLVTLQAKPALLGTWRRWSYAGFYIDERYTRMALKCWPTRWTSKAPATIPAIP